MPSSNQVINHTQTHTHAHTHTNAHVKPTRRTEIDYSYPFDVYLSTLNICQKHRMITTNSSDEAVGFNKLTMINLRCIHTEKRTERRTDTQY